MNNTVYYKVLLVDDNKALGASLQPQAERYGLDLHQFDCWDDARQVLINKSVFSEWDAIILDARCVNKKDEPADLHFLGPVLNELTSLFERHCSATPWYVLTAGGKEDFDFVMNDIRCIPRDEAWGKMLFYKDSPANDQGKNDVDLLFESIIAIAPKRTRNRILHQYREAFSVMNSCLFEQESQNLLIEILTALHFPEENKGFNPILYYNRLRQLLEYIFRAANKVGLLPDYFVEGGKVNLQGSSLYLAGGTFTPSKDPAIVSIRFGDEGESVFHKNIADVVKNVLSVTSQHSHTIEINKEDEEELLAYYSETGSPNLLFGYALQLCEVIIWLGNYTKIHNNKEANLAKCRVVNKMDVYEGNSFLLEQDEKKNLHCGLCLVSFKDNQDNIGKMVRLSGVGENKQTGELQKKYPYFARKVEKLD